MLSLFGSGLGPEQGVATTATLESPYPNEAGGVQVTFDGNPAPLLWVQDSQINVIAPWSLTPGQKTEICVNNNGTKTNCQTWPVWETAPGVFTTDGFYSLAINQDGTLNSAGNPAPAGSNVTVFANGLGPLTPPLPDGSLVGLPLPANALTVAVGGFCCGWLPTTFEPDPGTSAGPVQGMPAGVTEVTFQTYGGSQYAMCVPLGVCTLIQIYGAEAASNATPAARPGSSARRGDSPPLMSPAFRGRTAR